VLAQAQAIQEIGGDSPPVTVALHRLLLAIIYRTTRLEDSQEWRAVWEKASFDVKSFDDYFEKWRHRFDLFDQQMPFYQVGSLDPNLGGSSARLFFHWDNNATLFTHLASADPPNLPPAEAARHLVGFMGFDTGGLKTQGSAKAATLTKGAVVLVRGKNLYETLMLNLCQYAPEEGEPWDFDRDQDIPVWERDAETRPEDRRPDGYIDLLTWQSRRIRLQPETAEDGCTVVKAAVIMKGFQLPANYTVHNKETMMAFRSNPNATRGQDPWPAVTFKESRALWRDSLALLGSSDGESEQPKTLAWLADLASDGVFPHSLIVPVDTFGLSSNQAKILFWRHERLPIPLAYLDNRLLVESLREALHLTETAAQDLGQVVWVMAKEVLPPDSKREVIRPFVDHLGADRAYWSRLEGPFKRLMVDLTTDRDEDGTHGGRQLPEWKKTLSATLWNAFAEATQGMERSTRTLKAMAGAEQRLAVRTSRHLAILEEGGEYGGEVRGES
jgi:CRISPR system Cascade subunit CasA